MSSGPSASWSDAPSPGPPAQTSFVARWLPVVVWATFISWFSTDAFSARSTNSYIDPVLRYLFGELTPAGFRLAHTIIRKGAHLTEYAVLGMLICRALTPRGTRLQPLTIVRAILYCALYALADEAHQALVPSRTGSPVDVLIDVTGSTTGILLLAWRRRSEPISDRSRVRASDPSSGGAHR